MCLFYFSIKKKRSLKGINSAVRLCARHELDKVAIVGESNDAVVWGRSP